MPDGRHPRGREGPKQEVSNGHDQIGEHKRTAEAKTVSQGTAQDGQEPGYEPKRAEDPAGEFGRKVQLLVQVNGKDGSRGVVSDALENLGEIRSPESGLEASANLAQPLSSR